MDQAAHREALMREYLLGGLSSAEMEHVEKLLITDDTFYDEIVAFEDELVDRYITNGLSDRERERFETNYLISPERRRQVSFARGLKRYMFERGRPVVEDPLIEDPPVEDFAGDSEPLTARPSRPRFLFTNNRSTLLAIAAMMLAVISGAVWVTVKNWRSDHLRSERSVGLIVTPGTLRGAGQTARVTIPADVGVVELHLRLRGTPSSEPYRAVVGSDTGTVYTSDQLHPNPAEITPTIVVRVPARSVPIGDYQVHLNRITAQGSDEEVDTYNFTVRPGN
jgi:hypothetical protein